LFFPIETRHFPLQTLRTCFTKSYQLTSRFFSGFNLDVLSVSNTTYIHKKYSINSSYDAQSPGISWNFWVPLASLRAGASVLRSMRALRVLRAFRLLRLLKMSRLSAWGEISVQISHFFRLSYVLQPVPSCTYKILQIRISYFKFILILCYCFDMILLCLEFITMFYCYFSMHTLTYNHICMCIYIYIHMYNILHSNTIVLL
jgi:hypothetical protein